jgi:3-(methylthio)propanoyl-CoA dehydrogenase
MREHRRVGYIAPIRDLQFVIKELGEFDKIAALSGHNEVTGELIDTVLEEAGKFACGVLSPLNAVGDKIGCKWNDAAVTTPPGFKQAYRQFCAGGWPALHGDAAFGGQGLPHVLAHPISEIWNGADMAFCLGPMLTFSAVLAKSNNACIRQAHQRRVDGYDESHRAASRLRSGRGAHARGAASK